MIIRTRTQESRAVSGKRDLLDEEAQPLHLWIGREEAAAEEGGEALMGRTRILERHGVDEVLHGVGRDHLAVIALGVGGEEIVPEHIDADPAGQQPTDLVRPVEGHVVLAVAAVGFHERNRASALATMARSPSSISSSR